MLIDESSARRDGRPWRRDFLGASIRAWRVSSGFHAPSNPENRQRAQIMSRSLPVSLDLQPKLTRGTEKSLVYEDARPYGLFVNSVLEMYLSFLTDGLHSCQWRCYTS